MRPLLRDVEWEPCPLPPTRHRELEAMAKKAFGQIPSALYYLAHSPWVTRAQIRMSHDQGLLVHFDFELAEIVTMAVSQQSSCRYCYGVSRALLRILGRSEEQVLEIERQLSERANDPRTAAALTFARRMARADPLARSADRRPLLDLGFTSEEIRELAFVAAYTMFANRTCTIVAAPPYPLESLPDRWWVRLLRPLIASSVRRHVRRGEADPASPEYTGPYAYVVRAFAGSPISRAIAEALDDAWSSPELTRRCKALLFAVVGKALGCDLAAVAAREVLAGEGFADDELTNALEHLSSPRFDAVERVLVPFARETVWYEPAPIQRRARALLEHVTPAQFVAAVGITALANALCRLGAAAADPS